MHLLPWVGSLPQLLVKVIQNEINNNIFNFFHSKVKYEVTEDVYTSRKKQHQTMMHYFCALNTLQYKKKIALLEPLLGYMQAQVNTVLYFGL